MCCEKLLCSFTISLQVDKHFPWIWHSIKSACNDSTCTFLELYSYGSFRTLIILINTHFALVVINYACYSSVSLNYFTQTNIRFHSKFFGLYNQHIYLQYYDIIFSQNNISNLSDLILVRSLYKSLFRRIIAFWILSLQTGFKTMFLQLKTLQKIKFHRAILFLKDSKFHF